MKWFQAVAGVLAIFILGMMTGALGTGWLVKQKVATFREHGPPPVKPMLMKRLANQLDLTPDQRIEIEKILDNLQKDLRKLRKDVEPEVRSAFQISFGKIRKILTPIQQEKLDEYLQKFPRHFPPGHRHWRHDDHHPPGPLPLEEKSSDIF